MEHMLIIPGRLDNLNDFISAERSNRYKGAQMKSHNEDIVYTYIKKCLKSLKICNPVYIEYLWVEKNTRRDLDNISSFGRKVIQDALVKAGTIQNDGWAHIVGFSDRFEVDKKNPRIEVKIIEIGEENG